MLNLDAKTKKRIMAVGKIAIFVLVMAGIGRTIWQAADQFRNHDYSLANVNFAWVAAAGGLYLAGMLPMGIFWHAVLRALQQRPSVGTSLRAFYLGHLGKYVPGKAMVVVIRTGFVKGPDVDTTAAAVSVFVETLTTMAVGAAVAAVTLAIFYANQSVLVFLALGLLLTAGVPTWPPLFRRVIRLLQVARANPRIDALLQGLNIRLMGLGWLAASLGWLLIGASLWAVLQAMPGASEGLTDQPLGGLPLVIATVALAVVAGFVSLIPGGLGVREFVLMQLLAPWLGPVIPLLSAVLLRLSWLMSEVIVSIILYLPGRLGHTPNAPGVPAE